MKKMNGVKYKVTRFARDNKWQKSYEEGEGVLKGPKRILNNLWTTQHITKNTIIDIRATGIEIHNSFDILEGFLGVLIEKCK